MKISRRVMLGTVAAAPLAVPAIARAQPLRWRMVTSWPKRLPGPGMSAERVAERIAAMSGGRLQIAVHAAGEIVPAFEVMDAVGGGVAEMAHTASFYWTGKQPAAAFFTTVPFGLTPHEHVAWVEAGGGQSLWDKLYEPFGVKPFMAGNTGVCMGGWFRRELSTPDDLRGLKVRALGLGGEVYRRLGATPQTTPAGEIVPALQSGVLDAVEFVGPGTDIALGLYRITQLYYAPGFNKPNGTGECLVSLKAWEKLDSELKAIVAHACAAEASHALSEMERLNVEALAALTTTHKVRLMEFSSPIIEAARTQARDVVGELGARGALAAEVLASYRQFGERMAAWSRISLRPILILARLSALAGDARGAVQVAMNHPDALPVTAPSIADIREAAKRLQGVAVRTPLLHSPVLDEATGARVFLKAETLQRTGSFKFRGAYNKLARLPASQRGAGVVAFSSGNHAQGVAAAAAMLRMPAVIVMPADAPRTKIERTRALGAEVVFYDRAREDREAIAAGLAQQRGAAIVPPYDDLDIIAGQGTVGLEIADDLAALNMRPDFALCPVSGGGLMAGTAIALRHAFPDARLFSAEPEGFDDHARSLHSGRRESNARADGSICDALLARMPGELTFRVNQKLLAGGLVATEHEVARAVAFAFRELKLVVEPGGAVALATLLSGDFQARGRIVVAVLSGGNADADLFARLIAAQA